MSAKINFNTQFQEITEENIFKFISDYDIFNYYIENFEVNAAFNSPLRKDETPSFSVFKSNHGGDLLFKDFGNGHVGTAITLVKELYSISYYEALCKVIVDFGIQDYFSGVKSLKRSKKQLGEVTNKIVITKRSKIEIKVRNWTLYDLSYWETFGITIETLRKYWVFPISHFFINNRLFIAAKYAYAFVERKDKQFTYKIYQPFNKIKWLTNHYVAIHQGYSQLPEEGKLLLITKALKDVMSLHDVADISSIGIQNETILIKESVMKEYKMRFKEVLCLFDNDETGINLSNKYKKEYNIDYILLPDKKTKDFSDCVKVFGKEKALLTLKTLLK